LVGKPEGKRPLGRPRCRWVDIIEIDLREIGWDGIDWIDLAQDRNQRRALVNRSDEPSSSIKCWEVLEKLYNWQLLKKGSTQYVKWSKTKRFFITTAFQLCFRICH
jgi:hypothetical protein